MVGAGNRGARIYGAYALEHPRDLRFVAVVEPDDDRRRYFAETHRIPIERQFTHWEELAGRAALAPAAVNTTLDQTHLPSTLALLEAGYEVLLEKPMATTPEACLALVEAAEQYGRILQIGHVLRFAPFFRAIHDLVTTGRLGEVVSIDWRENLAYWHYAHSFVRGNWSNAQTSAPMILTKCCHDLDLLVWMLGPCDRVASFGAQRRFTPDQVGPEVPARCLDGCPHAETCVYYAPRLYLEALARDPQSFMARAATLDLTPEGVMRALEVGPYGRCVWRCSNNVVDHQVVLMRFPGEQAVSLTMQGASHVEGRTVRIDGLAATLLADQSRHEIRVIDHGSGRETLVELPPLTPLVGGHAGGDARLIEAFVGAVRSPNPQVLTSARESLESHLLAFAAELARTSGEAIDMAEYRVAVEQRRLAGVGR